jgi:ribonuclease BN (tRNA processing enzyme)
VELVVLGCDGSWPGPGGAASGYLVRHDGFAMWMDAGFGTIGRLQGYVALTELDAVLLSHGHRDHVVDLYALFASRRFGRSDPQDLPVYALPGVKESMAPLISSRSGDAWEQTFDWRELGAGDHLSIGPLDVECFEMQHFGPALGFRMSADGGAIAYTGDTGPCEAVGQLAEGADIFLAEATWQDSEKTHDKHLTAREAAEYASVAEVGMLVLTHLEPGHDVDVSLAQAREAFDGEVVLAEPGMRLEVGE